MFDVKVETLIYLILFMPLLGALVNGLLGSFMPRRWVSIIGAGSVFSSFFFGLIVLFTLVRISKSGVESPSISATLYRWIETGWLNVDFSLWIDPLSVVMVLVVTGVGSFIHLYSVGYMRNDRGYYRYFAYLNLFTFSMLLLG
ncbi:MAG: NADH-quinone oxidoreductase subunit L, partial [Deltaproteobacteria bacterium]|nr:NADH-quinone oxidoreductase subunit L [Deltaproteobacteria bacterium]